MAGIFISYRRDDSAATAGRLYDRLVREFPKDKIFMDIDAIDYGDDFLVVINQRLDSSSVVLALIGKAWTSCADASGTRRLDNPDDFVRMELSAALSRKVRVIPVLVGGVGMPQSTQMPDELKPLARRHALDLSDDIRFHSDVDRLIETLRKELGFDQSPQPDSSTRKPSEIAATPIETTEGAQRPKAAVAESGRRPSMRLMAALAAAVIAVIGGVLYVTMWPTGVEVPNLVGKSSLEAHQAITSIGLAVASQIESESDSASPGTVIGQKPPAGTALESGSGIDLTVAKAVRIEVPNLIGQSLENAKSVLLARNLILGQAETRKTFDVPSGTILTQNPAAGERVAKGGSIQVAVAENTAISLPDLRGRTLTQAKNDLAGLGLELSGVEYRTVNNQPAGVVLDQQPAAAEKLEAGGKVKLVVAVKPDPQVPSLDKLPLSEAKLALERAGFLLGEVKTVGYVTGNVAEPMVRSQSVAAGTRMKSGGRVDVVVAGLGAQVPELIGMSLEKAKIQLERNGLSLGSVKEQPDSTTKAGAVISQSVGGGKWVSKGKSIDLVVASKPTAGSSIAMPSVLGMPLRDAVARLRALGFSNIKTSPVYDLPKKAGEVLIQTPDAGDQVSSGAQVTLKYFVLVRMITAPAQASSYARSDPQQQASQQCPSVCASAGGKWGGKANPRGDTVSCACEIF